MNSPSCVSLWFRLELVFVTAPVLSVEESKKKATSFLPSGFVVRRLSSETPAGALEEEEEQLGNYDVILTPV